MKRLTISFFALFILVCMVNAQENATAENLQADLNKYSSLFSDQLLTAPSSKANLKKAAKIKTPLLRQALVDMLEGTYSSAYRIQTYRSYLHPKQLAALLKTSPYSQFENPTGIYFKKDEEIVLFVEDIDRSDNEIKLRVKNFGEEGGDSSYELTPGLNIIVPTNNGNGYIHYFTEQNRRAKDVKIHILGGYVNGYFDVTKHTNADWVKLLSAAESDILDIIGTRVQLAYSVQSLQKYCPEDGFLLTSLYDSIISIQHEIMGLNKYKRVPDNHIFGRVIWNGFMHADGMGAAFHDNTMEHLANPANIGKHLWGIAHEFGHVNQVRPWMKWVGTTEVTNNIYSVWSQYLFNPEEPKLEREVLKDYDGRVAGGRITSYMESAFIHKQQWLTQAGPDRWDRHRPRDWGGDHFVKLVPLWQLQLYYVKAGKDNAWYQPDFYADMFIRAIDKDYLPSNDAEAQLSFIKAACDVTQTDLTAFFEQSGMLAPIDLWVDDYTCAQMTITEEDIAEVKKYVSKYKKQETPVMHYITANSLDCYQYQLPVNGEYGKGIVAGENGLTIDHAVWKNVVAFETYQGDELVKIAFGGAGSNDNKTTLVRYPEHSTRVEAVAWDGKRQLVYGER